MRSIWWESCKMETRDTLKGDIETEIAVIGGGMAGMLTAYLLQEAGKQVVVLEKDCIAHGQTGFTTAKITSQHGMCYHKLWMDFGEEKAPMYARANERAIGEYRRIIQKENIDCDFKEEVAYLYSNQKESLEKEYEAVKKLELPGTWVEETEFFHKNAIKFSNQAQFHPLKFLKAIGKHLTVYENTKVLEVEEQKVITTGGTVSAEYIVFACHFPFVNFPGLYFMRMHQERAYFLALEQTQLIEGMFIGADPGGHSLRGYEGVTLFGGENHRTGENSAGGCYERLRGEARKLFPRSHEIGCWSAQDCMTVDGVPYIGQFSKKTPRWLIATGFGKWGMSTSMVAGCILRDMICGKAIGDGEVFDPGRFTAIEVPEVLKGGGQAVKGLTRRFFALPKAEASALPLGHGGVVEIDGEKLGVFKDKEGSLFLVEIACPHLGCQLEWNPDELSWDCPCHGSRFDYFGKLLSNPAQEDITYE